MPIHRCVPVASENPITQPRSEERCRSLLLNLEGWRNSIQATNHTLRCDADCHSLVVARIVVQLHKSVLAIAFEKQFFCIFLTHDLLLGAEFLRVKYTVLARMTLNTVVICF